MRKLLLAALFLLPHGSFAQSHNPYIQISSVDYIHLLPGAPIPGSSEDREDFRALHEWQDKRTTEECKAAQSEGAFKLSVFQQPRGPLNASEIKAVWTFFENVKNDIAPIWQSAKKHWKRPRPFLVDSTLHPCPGMNESSYAYPSGHSAAGYVFGKILSEIYPERATALMSRAIEIGEHRIVGGVHHPTDVRDGKVLAERVLQLLNRNPTFVQDLDEVKTSAHSSAVRLTNSPDLFLHFQY